MGLNDVYGTFITFSRASFTKPEAANALACAALTEVGGMHIVKTGARATRRGSGGRRSKSRLFTAEPTHKNARPASCGGDFAVFGLITPEKKPFFAFSPACCSTSAVRGVRHDFALDCRISGSSRGAAFHRVSVSESSVTRAGMAPARGAEGAPIVGRDGADTRLSRTGDDENSFFTPRAALLFGVVMVGALFWEEALELRIRARQVVFGEQIATGPTFLVPRRAGAKVGEMVFGGVDYEDAGEEAVKVPSPSNSETEVNVANDRDDETQSASVIDTSAATVLTTYLPEVPEAIGGEYRSLGKVKSLDGVPDVTKTSDSIADAAARRSYKKEIIILMANSRGCHLAANSIANLRSVGIEHYLLVTNTQETCEGMKLKSKEFDGNDNNGWNVECGWTSFLKNHPRLNAYGVTQEERSDPFRLWWARFHLLERFVSLGYNPMYLDTDVSFRVNPYSLLKGPFKEFKLIGQDETGSVNGVNIGFVYCQSCKVDGPAHRVLNETVARMFAILEHEPGPVTQWDGRVAMGAKEHLWDQHIYNDVIESAVFNRYFNRRSGQQLIDKQGNHRQRWVDSPEQNFPKWQKTRWDEMEVDIAEEDIPKTKDGVKMALEPGTVQARGKYLNCVGGDVPGYQVATGTSSSSPDSSPESSPTTPKSCSAQELFLASPPWFLGGWSGVSGDEKYQGVLGRWNLDPPIVAVAHFVGALAKLQTFKQLGWWQYGAELFRPNNVLGLREIEKGLDEGGVLGVRGLKAASSRAVSDVGDGVKNYGAQVARLVQLAVALGKRPAVPEIDCSAPWVGRSDTAFLSVKDRERVVLGTQCLADGALVGGWDYKMDDSIDGDSIKPGHVQCCATVNFACDEGVIWQVDLDNDPRFQGLRESVEVVDVAQLPTLKYTGEVDVNASAAFLKNKPKLIILDLQSANGEVPEVDINTVSDDQREQIDLVFNTCDRLDCRPPKRPFPHDVDPCRVPR